MAADRRVGVSIDPAWIGPPRGPALHNPTLWLFAVSTVTYFGSLSLYLQGTIPYWIFLPLSGIALFWAYTVLHEGVHGCLHGSRLINSVISRICGFMLIFSFPMFRALHHAHHHDPNSHTDPDAIVGRMKVSGVLFGGPLIFFNYYYVFYARLAFRNPGAAGEAMATHLLQVFVIIVALLQGRADLLFFAGILPLLTTLWFLVFFFDFLPHYPHKSGDPRGATLAYGGRVWNAILLGQNFHLVHHLWPRIPWFRYRQVFETTHDELRTRGYRVG